MPQNELPEDQLSPEGVAVRRALAGDPVFSPSGEESHQVHMLEMTDKNGKIHHVQATVGGVRSMTPEQLAKHLTNTNHFRGQATKIVVKRGGLETVKSTLAKMIRDPKSKHHVPTPAPAVVATVEPHPEGTAPSTSDTPPSPETKPAATPNESSTAPSTGSAPVAVPNAAVVQ